MLALGRSLKVLDDNHNQTMFVLSNVQRIIRMTKHWRGKIMCDFFYSFQRCY